ncbi:C-X-C motif chemokine 9-like [Cyprinodon tularosa]|uniref:C-X-C motif chemokine 9-like n=1 Tax=Cyprinodon tularosa TaxID=77115 RepID=UPI0018E2778B|nr:C-X-C motif chemokine 9-like [Cyprinodon tularosa]
MKILLTLCLLTFLYFLRSSSAGPVAPELGGINGSCCLHNSNMTILRGKVKDLEMSPNHCQIRSVIVTTVSERRFCLDPTGSWTKKLLKEFEKRILH